jgi:hypothetical protein
MLFARSVGNSQFRRQLPVTTLLEGGSNPFWPLTLSYPRLQGTIQSQPVPNAIAVDDHEGRYSGALVQVQRVFGATSSPEHRVDRKIQLFGQLRLRVRCVRDE